MPISSISVGRVSQNMRFTSMLATMQQNQFASYVAQNRIASGRSFVTIGENPAGATRALNLNQAFEQQNQFVRNLTHADNVLSATDNAITELNPLLADATRIALQNIGDITDPAERESEASLIAGIRAQFMMLGNRQLDGRFIFAGRQTLDAPFVDALGGVAYLGDTGDLLVRTDLDQTEIVNVPGNILFGALSSQIVSSADLTPAVTAATRLSDLSGVDSEQLRQAYLIVNDAAAGAFTVDLSKADTVGDVADAINAAATHAGSGLTASVTTTGLQIEAGSAGVTITDTGSGEIAASMGVLVRTETSGTITGETLNPRVTRLTPVTDLARGAGIDVENGLTITNGPDTATIDLSDVQTVQDIINRIASAGVYVLARINDEGTGIDLFNQVSGTSLTIGENGGTTAADLGLRTMERATPLTNLNFGDGIGREAGEDDLQITAGDGTAFTVNLDEAQTIGDVIDLINAAAEEAGAAVTASLVDVGNGIRIADATGGTGQLTVANTGLSFAAERLGIAQTAQEEATEIIGQDVNPTRAEGVFDVLLELERALLQDDTQGISRAAQRLDELVLELTRTHGVIGARARNVQNQLQQMQDTAATTQIFLSEVEDLDYTEAVTELTAAQTQLQASMQSASTVLNLSLLDFLR